MPDWQRIRQWSRVLWGWVSHIDTVLGWWGRVAVVVVAVGSTALSIITSNAYWLIPVSVAVLMIAVGIIAVWRSPLSESSSGVVFPKGEIRAGPPTEHNTGQSVTVVKDYSRIATFGDAPVSPFSTSMDGPLFKLVRVMVLNPMDETFTFRGKVSWLHNRQPIHDAWEACWARTPNEEASIGGRDRREINLTVIDERGFAAGIKPSFPIELHSFKRPLFDGIGELGVRVWRDSASGFAACGIRMVDRGPHSDPLVTRDDSVLPNEWRTDQETSS